MEANTSAQIREETIRRLELLLLHVLHHVRVLSRSSPRKPGHRKVSHSGCLTRQQLWQAFQWLTVAPTVYQNLMLDRTITQRDLYYTLVRRVPSQCVSDRCVRQLALALNTSRGALQVVAGQRGVMSGSIERIVLTTSATFATGSGGVEAQREHLIPVNDDELSVMPFSRLPATRPDEVTSDDDSEADASPVKRRRLHSSSSHHRDALTRPLSIFRIHRSTRAIVVVEKYTIYHRLMQEGFGQPGGGGAFPCVLVTSHGFPTFAARRLVSNMNLAVREATSSFSYANSSCCSPTTPSSPPLLVALVDYNPSGAAILCQYKLGGSSRHVSERRCGAPDIRWLGVRSAHIRTRKMTATAPSSVTFQCGHGSSTSSAALADAAATVSSSAAYPSMHTLPHDGLSAGTCAVPFTPFQPRDDTMLERLISELSLIQSACDTALSWITLQPPRHSTTSSSSAQPPQPAPPLHPWLGDDALLALLDSHHRDHDHPPPYHSREPPFLTTSSRSRTRVLSGWLDELRQMQSSRVKVEVESAILEGGFPERLPLPSLNHAATTAAGGGLSLTQWVTHSILSDDYV